MVAPLLTPQDEQIVLDELLASELPLDSAQPEQRIVFSPISWDQYLAFDKKLDDDRPGPRLYYLDGELELAASSNEYQKTRRWINELVRLQPELQGPQPEQRIVFSPVSWERYLVIDKKLGHDRPGPRLYYLEGQLEFMTTSHQHERFKKWLADLLAIYFEETGIEIMPRGQTTMRLREAGAEPDESWCIGQEKPFPDLVLEIALTSGGLNKLEIYRRFQIPEVWFWRRNKLELFALNSAASYEPVRKSRLLPELDISLLERCVAINSWQKARQTFRASLPKAQ